MESNLDRSVAEQAKFQYYWTALTFTLLAASVQSADLGNYRGVTYVLEISGWACLLLSGLQLLRFLEARGKNMRSIGFVEEHEDALLISDADEEKLGSIKTEANGSREKMFVAYRWARFLFITGICFVIFARAVHGFLLLAL